ncbi:MAG: transporter substrate-binding domain-containing protein [Burkholderiales bacterium]|nr:transporter substrate-binding domain-containing protein [Burkholderiales bacterium]
MKITALALATVAAFAAAAVHAEDTLKKIADRGKISVSYREASVPFSYVVGAEQPVGYSVDITKAIISAVRARVNKPVLEIEWVPVTSQNRIPLLANGTIDLECGSTTNNIARGKDVDFAVNYFYTGNRLLAKKASKIRDYGDLAGKTVATTTGSTNGQVMRRMAKDKGLDFNILLGKDHNESMLLVENDRAVAFAMDDVLLYGLAAGAKNPAEWEIVAEAVAVEPYACMLRKDDPKFKKLVDGVIGGLMKSGEFEKIYNKWYTQPIPPKGINLKLPMNQQLRENLKALSDKPAA